MKHFQHLNLPVLPSARSSAFTVPCWSLAACIWGVACLLSAGPSARRTMATATSTSTPLGEEIMAFHERSKHSLDVTEDEWLNARYAPGPGRLDWRTQPIPFRVFEGAPVTPLPRSIASDVGVLWRELAVMERVPAPVNLTTVSDFLFHSMALSAQKRAGTSSWFLRVNPSSGNLHPTEPYLIFPYDVLREKLVDSRVQVLHYNARMHGLALRGETGRAAGEALRALLPGTSFLLGLSSILARESWKYGIRAFRYCNHDVGYVRVLLGHRRGLREGGKGGGGTSMRLSCRRPHPVSLMLLYCRHAIAAVSLAARMLGWQARVLDDVPAPILSGLLGLHRAGDFHPGEAEYAEVLVQINTNPTAPSASPTRAEVNASLATVADALTSAGVWNGRANRLSESVRDWNLDRLAAITAAGSPPASAERRSPCLDEDASAFVSTGVACARVDCASCPLD